MNNTLSKEEAYVKQFVQEGLNREGYVFELGGRIVGNITGSDICDLIIEYAKQEAIGFMTWVYSRGFFVQWKDGVAGHIRQENQILFSAWQPLESTYEQYLLHKQNKEQ